MHVDALYAETKPTIGEPVDPTNPDYQPMARFLYVRLLEAQERHPDWGVVPLDTTDRPAELRWGGRDGSVLVFLVSPW